MNKEIAECPELNCSEGTYVSPINGKKSVCNTCNGVGYIYVEHSEYCTCGNYMRDILPNNICRDCGRKVEKF